MNYYGEKKIKIIPKSCSLFGCRRMEVADSSDET